MMIIQLLILCQLLLAYMHEYYQLYMHDNTTRHYQYNLLLPVEAALLMSQKNYSSVQRKQ